MQKILSLMLGLTLAVLILNGCTKNNPIAPSMAVPAGKMSFAMEAADNIASGKVTITKGALTHALPITITDHTGSVTFNSIQIGHWHINVQLFDVDGVEIYSGESNALVLKNQTTTAKIRVIHNTGNLIVEVEVPGLLL